MRIEGSAGVWEGPELAGAAGRRVRALALDVLVDSGALDLALTVGAGMAAEDAQRLGALVVARVGAHARAEAAALATLSGWSLDGVPWSRASREALPLEHDEEHWAVVVEVWMAAGFFGGTLRQSVRMAREAAPTT